MDGFDEDISRHLGCGEIGPVEPPEKLRVRKSTRRPWLALGVFTIAGATSIMLFAGPNPPAANLGKLWQASPEESDLVPEPVKREPLVSDEVYAVDVEGLPAVGRADARVTLAVVSDYACGRCEKARETVNALRNAYGADLRVVWKPKATSEDSYPILMGACAAGLQGQFQAFDDAAWRITVEKSRQLGLPIKVPERAQVMRLARDAGLDIGRFASAMPRCEPMVRASTRELTTLGVDGPTFFVNGRYVDPWGDDSIVTFQKLIDDELVLAKQRIAAGASADRYYREWVVARGKKTR